MPRITNFTPLHIPILGMVGGHLVTCTAYADVEGNSPSFLYADLEGRLTWVSFDQFRSVDHRATNGETLRGITAAAGR
jgi:hypothetical protein